MKKSLVFVIAAVVLSLQLAGCESAPQQKAEKSVEARKVFGGQRELPADFNK